MCRFCANAFMRRRNLGHKCRLTPHGVSGLKLSPLLVVVNLRSLTPHGVSGLKYEYEQHNNNQYSSHPAWGEWIEIGMGDITLDCAMSHPAWGEWIEITCAASEIMLGCVSPRMG